MHGSMEIPSFVTLGSSGREELINDDKFPKHGRSCDVCLSFETFSL